MTESCEACLRRAHLIAHLAPSISGLLGRRRPALAGLLCLPEDELILATAGRSRAEAFAFRDAFDPRPAREWLVEQGVLAICRHHGCYPPQLEELADPPAVLFAAGRPATLETIAREPAVAIVGTRNPSSYGAEVAHALGRGLGSAGVPIVSGLALGIDATAHRGCLEGAGVPVAVLACGPDLAYPRRHRSLHARVREHGVVLSELPPGTEPFRWSFPARNRIMAGLARMTIVVEAAQPSGSLITSDFARDLGRSVAAVPGRVTSSRARGSNALIRDGAVPILQTADVLDELFGAGVRPVVGRAPPDDPGLLAVLEAAESSSSIAAIAGATGLETGAVRAALGRLEAAGHLVRAELGGWERRAW